ncbi:MAG: glycogen/starch synthase, partial [Calditrichia bacterium]
YKSINERKFVLREVIRLKEVPVTLNGETLVVDGKTAFLPNSKVHVYFLHLPDYFDRKDLYVDSATGKDFEDNAERFAFFSKAVLETLKLLYWQPDIIHCNDWQTALIPYYLKTHYKDDEFFQNTRTVLTIHNLAYQGSFPLEKAAKVGISEEYIQPGREFEFYGKLNFLKGGILFADILNTVSKRYAEEILSDPEMGAGFTDILKSREKNVFGILNGVDYTSWNPEDDELIYETYTSESLDKKSSNKKVLCKQNNLKYSEDVPMIGIISRLVDQKGFDLIAEAIEKLMKMNLQLVILGTGDPQYHELFQNLCEKYPEKLAVNLRFDNKLAHLIEAGSDMFLMPSRYEPCGLNQLYSLKYGTIPIVRETGGLADTIIDYTENPKEGNGFTFKEYTADAMMKAVQRAVDVYKDSKKWTAIQKKGMQEDYSWDRAAREYLSLYEKTMTE